jgi:predicted SAM-dependent methyltransferase
MKDALYMQFGSGQCAPNGWLNFDASPTLRFERLPLIGLMYTRNAARFPAGVVYGDIVKGLPIDVGSCAGIYCSHVLEHLSLTDCETALSNVCRYLRPGGVFRCVMPDLRRLVERYLADSSPDAAARFMDYTGLGWRKRPHCIREVLQSYFAHNRHLWLWDERALRNALCLAGFQDIRRAVYDDSHDPRFHDVEDPARFECAVAIECRK